MPTPRDARAVAARGYAHVRHCLSADDVAALKKHYDDLPWSPNKNYPLKYFTRALPDDRVTRRVEAKVKQAVAHLTADQHISVVPPTLAGAVFFATNPGGATSSDFGLHQDSESYCATNDHHNYLNFYFCIDKVDTQASNLVLVPFPASAGAWKERVAGNGASGYHLVERRSTFLQNLLLGRPLTPFPAGVPCRRTIHVSLHAGDISSLGVDLKELAEVPCLEPGDLLVIRGDVVHSTQNTSTRRVALSVRAVDEQAARVRADALLWGVDAVRGIRRRLQSHFKYLLQKRGMGNLHLAYFIQTWQASETFYNFRGNVDHKHVHVHGLSRILAYSVYTCLSFLALCTRVFFAGLLLRISYVFEQPGVFHGV